ncbi:MAG: DUF3987 domain-containing protein [Nostoc sp.]|uniref:DUF3987 domain-containing protein n=1 Tax=Nostoc sp. TaxID=1180 RepID=UPI002FFD2488
MVLTSLLTSVSSLHKVGTEVILHKNLNFAVPPTLYSAIVAESGSKKSPIFRATAKLPLNGLKQSRVDEYLQNLKDYQTELDAWEEENANLKKGVKPRQPKPTEPAQPPIFYFTDGTGESIKSQAQKAPDKALFLLCDELAGYFASQDKYFGGKGSDKQDLLSYYDGTGATVLRAGGVKVDVPRIYLSILGTIQPDIIKKIMGNTNDLDGSWSRWLFAIQPNIPTTLPDDVPCGVDCTDVMTGYFEKVFDLPLTKYKLSQEAFRIYQPFYNRLEQLRVLYPTSGFRAVYAKAEGLAGRLALNLHVLYEFAEGRIPSQVIGSDMMHRAIALMKFYIGQVRMVHAFVNDGDSVAPLLLKVIELSKRNQLAGEEGWIKASDVQKNTTRAKRPSAVEARNWMIQASNLGYGIIRGEGSKIEFRTSLQNSIDKIDKNRQTIDTVSILETLAIQGVPKNIDKIDDLKHSDTISDDTPHTTILNRQPIDDSCLFGLSNLESIDVASNPTIHSPSIITSIECLSFNKETQEVMATTGAVMTPQSQSQPEYKVGDGVEFKHPDSCNIDWIKGRIDDVNCQQGYFISYTISYLQRGKNSTCKLHRQDWVRVVR